MPDILQAIWKLLSNIVYAVQFLVGPIFPPQTITTGLRTWNIRRLNQVKKIVWELRPHTNLVWPHGCEASSGGVWEDVLKQWSIHLWRGHLHPQVDCKGTISCVWNWVEQDIWWFALLERWTTQANVRSARSCTTQQQACSGCWIIAWQLDQISGALLWQIVDTFRLILRKPRPKRKICEFQSGICRDRTEISSKLSKSHESDTSAHRNVLVRNSW